MYVWKHKGLMQPRFLTDRNVHVHAFLPDVGLWRDLFVIPDGTIRISPAAKTLLVRFADINFLDAFGENLTKAERPYNQHGVVWPPSPEARDIVIHGLGSRLIRVIFWREVSFAPEAPRLWRMLTVCQGGPCSDGIRDTHGLRYRHRPGPLRRTDSSVQLR